MFSFPRCYCRRLVRELRRLVLDPTTIFFDGAEYRFTRGDVVLTVRRWTSRFVSINGVEVDLYLLPRWRLRRAVNARLYREALNIIATKPEPKPKPQQAKCTARVVRKRPR